MKSINSIKYKLYMEIKIKSQGKLIDATLEVMDGVMIVSPIEKFEPKDGDVVYTQSDCF